MRRASSGIMVTVPDRRTRQAAYLLTNWRRLHLWSNRLQAISTSHPAKTHGAQPTHAKSSHSRTLRPRKKPRTRAPKASTTATIPTTGASKSLIKPSSRHNASSHHPSSSRIIGECCGSHQVPESLFSFSFHNNFINVSSDQGEMRDR